MGIDEMTGSLNRYRRLAIRSVLFCQHGPGLQTWDLALPNKEKGTVLPVPLMVIVGRGCEEIRRNGWFAYSNS